LILLAFFLPLAFYVLVLGIINRRPHPLMVSGPWDFVGILFAASGFLVLGGPFVISTLNENWRVFFVLGPHGASAGAGDRLWTVWLVMSVLYFVIVLAGAAGMVWLQRKKTAIYNIDLATLEEALNAACARLGLHPAHSGTSYLFDPAKDLLAAAAPKGGEGIAVEARPARQFALSEARQLVLMEVDYFRSMRHITLHWSAANSLLRKEVETELAQQLSDTLVPPGDLWAWLIILGLALLALSFLIAFGVIVYRRLWIGV
jgi:hypothetical protein